jgi:hypothetical protein
MEKQEEIAKTHHDMQGVTGSSPVAAPNTGSLRTIKDP